MNLTPTQHEAAAHPTSVACYTDKHNNLLIKRSSDDEKWNYGVYPFGSPLTYPVQRFNALDAANAILACGDTWVPFELTQEQRDSAPCSECVQKTCRMHYHCEHCKTRVTVPTVKVCLADVRTRRGKQVLIWKKVLDRYGNNDAGVARSQPATRCPRCFKEIWEAGAHIQQLFYYGDQYEPQNKLRTTSATYRQLIKAAGLKPSAPIKPRPIPNNDKGLTVVVTPPPPEVLADAASSRSSVKDDEHPLNRWANFKTHSKITESALREATRARGYR